MSAGVLRICELHDTIVVCLVQTKHSAGLIGFESLHSDDVILALSLASLIVRKPSRIEKPALNALPLCAAGIGASGAFFAGFSKGSGLSALTAAAHTAASPAAHLPVI